MGKYSNGKTQCKFQAFKIVQLTLRYVGYREILHRIYQSSRKSERNIGEQTIGVQGTMNMEL